MKNSFRSFSLSSLTVAVLTSMTMTSAGVNAQESDATEDAIEELVVKASRLKGTASAVLDERKNQAFVADILGAEQISRTGDSDAAAALRRLPGLTLVDGKFIYIRGLGERYSSTTLNGAAVPSPDPTRSVIPLDLFPSIIIESLSVQKSYSASKSAHFGGGSVDIRTKSIPSDFVFNIAGNIGGNVDNFGEGFTYNGGGNDWYGRDDGTRAAPESLQNLWRNFDSLNDLSQADNRLIAAELYNDYDPTPETLDPDLGVDLALGDRFEGDTITFGYLASLSYDNEWLYTDGFEGQDFTRQNDGTFTLLRGFDDLKETTHNVRWSGMLNFGLEVTNNHKFEFINLALNDTEDRIEDKLGNTNNVLLSEGLRVRDIEVTYEERTLLSNQITGTHTFPALNFLGIDWKYSSGRSIRKAPGNFESRFILADTNNDGIFDINNESSLRRATTAARYSFQELHDKVENYGFNISLPITLETTEIELKAGADFTEKSRNGFGRRIDLDTLAFDGLDLSGNRITNILTQQNLLNAPLSNSGRNLIRDTSIDGDDYLAGQLTDAVYVEGDFFFDNTWRITAGVRWEDFRQVTVGLKPSTGEFDLPRSPTEQDLAELALQDDDFYPSLAVTYFLTPEVQFRGSYAETVVRPDFREVASATYLDPLTGDPIGGTPSTQISEIKHYDFRWEWYLDTGENVSVGLFYKDITNPIESVQSPAQDGPPLIRIANADTGELYGVEVDFLKDFTFLRDYGFGEYADAFFLSGNVTLSDSEVKIDTQRVVEQTGVSTSITNTERRLTGHSRYVVNLNLGFDSPNGKHAATLAYNVFGPRIILPGIDTFEDSEEQPFHSLDLIYTYFPTFSTSLKFKVQNILDQERELSFDDTIRRSETRGIGFDLAFKWEF